MKPYHFTDKTGSIKRTSESGLTFELSLVMEGSFSPGRPAPPCRNPDSPAFSDVGDEMEIEIHDFYVEEACVEVFADDYSKAPGRNNNELLQHIQLTEDNTILEWLIELLAARVGVGPWNKLELTDDEHEDLCNEIAADVSDDYQAQEEYHAEAAWEAARDKRLGL